MKKILFICLLMLILISCSKPTENKPKLTIGIQFNTIVMYYEMDYEINFNTVPTSYGSSGDYDNEFEFDETVTLDMTIFDCDRTTIKIIVNDEVVYDNYISYGTWEFSRTFYVNN